MREYWTNEETEFFKYLWPISYIEDLQKIFVNKTVNRLYAKYANLKLRKEHRQPIFLKKYNNDYLGGYVSGLVDGEGCFEGNIRYKKNYIIVVPIFSLSLRKDDYDIIVFLQKYFGCGTIRYTPAKGNNKEQSRFTINKAYDIVTKVLPHFEKYPLIAKKKRDYILWKELTKLLAFRRTIGKNSKECEMYKIYEALRDVKKYDSNLDIKSLTTCDDILYPNLSVENYEKIKLFQNK